MTVSSVGVRDNDVLVGSSAPCPLLARTLGAAEAVGVMAACTDAAVAYAKERVQFGRTIGTFQAVKHHCADMLVAAELATAAVWDAARASADSADEFDLVAAMAAQLSFGPAGAQRPDEYPGARRHRVHLGARRTSVPASRPRAQRAARLTRRRRGRDDAGRPGTIREVSLDLPPEAEAIRAEVRAEAERIGALRGAEQRKALVEAGLMVPHWPTPWGREAGAVEQIVIDEELRAAGVKVPPLGITGWNIMTVNQYATPDQVERWVFKTLMGEYVWRQLFSEPDAGSDAAAVKTRATRATGDGRSTDRRCGRAEPSTVIWAGHGADGSGRAEARRYHDDGDRHARSGCRGAAAASDHRQRRLQRGVLQRRVRAGRRRRRDTR